MSALYSTPKTVLLLIYPSAPTEAGEASVDIGVNQELTYLTNIIRPATITAKYSAAAIKIRRPLARLKSSALCSAVRTPICPATTMDSVSFNDSGAGGGSDSGGLACGLLVMAKFAGSVV